MSFLNPLFLFGLAAAAVPILIHLFTRKRPREMRFPSIEFLSEVNRSEIRRLRLRQWLLLLLRTMAVAALALAMSRPALRGTAGLSRNASTTVVALVDRSASMGAMAPDGTLLASAKRALESLLTTLGPADELLLVPYDQGPQAVSARPLSDVARLRAETQALSPSARTTDHAPALEIAARALAESRSLNRELFWLSDFQATGFAGPGSGGPGAGGGEASGRLAVPAGPWGEVRVYLMPFVPVSTANVGLTDASLAPTESGTALTVAGDAHGARPGDLSVAVRDLSGDAELGRGYLSLPADGEASTLLPLARMPELGGVAVIPDDALALDNRRVFAAGHSGTVRVLLREEGSRSPVGLALEAGSPASGLAVTRVDAAQLVSRIAEADVVVLNDVPRLGPVEQQAVLDFHRGGGGLFLVLGSGTEPAAWAALLGELGVGALGAPETAAPGAAFRLRRAVAGHPVLSGFPARPGEPLSTGSFRSIPTLDLRAGPAPPRGRAAVPVRVLLEYDRAHPALVEAAHALVLVATLDPSMSDFPVSGAFLPLLHQCAKVLARGTAASSLEPGDRYSAPAGTGDWRIEDDRGQAIASEMATEAGATRITSAPLERPGFYRVLQGSTLRTTFAVNPARQESDLAPVPEASLVRAFPPGRAQVLRPGADLARRVREARYGRELWAWFVIAALVLLVAEMIVARWGMEGGRATASSAT